MIDLFVNWLGNTLSVSDDMIFIFGVVASLLILQFLLDFFRFLMYYISEVK